MSIFNKIKLSKPKRSLHNLSYPMRMSLGFGDLVPIICEKVVPGDKFKHSHEFLMRLSPFVSQVYQSFDVKVDYFFVPSRILWTNFEKFLVEDDSSLYPHPQMSLSLMYDGTHTMENTLVDYINKVSGKPAYVDNVFQFQPIDGSAIGKSIDCLEYAALIKIFLDYYADENLTVRSFDDVDYDYNAICDLFETLTHDNGDTYGGNLYKFFKLINGVNVQNDNPRDVFKFFKRAYPKDYFTSALPWAQRGPVVQIPLNGSGQVVVQANGVGRAQYEGVGVRYDQSDPQGGYVDCELFNYGDLAAEATALGTYNLIDNQANGSRRGIHPVSGNGEGIDTIKANVRNAPALKFRAVNVNGTATITDLRTAMTVQAWLEKNARAGVRYKEQLASHFGVRSKDYRLDRAEMLQTSKSHVSIGEVFTTAQNDDGTFVPGLGVSTGTGSNAVKPFKHFFEEHGYFIGFMSVYPKAAYSQGLPRQLFELDKFDYYWPEFQHIGEQEIYNCELYLDDDNPSRNFETFGYTPRYAHYKARQAEVHGDMLNTLNFMTLSRQFTNAPNLNQDFINIDPDKNHLYRAFNAVSPYGNALPVQVDFFHKFKTVRPMSYFGSPRIL